MALFHLFPSFCLPLYVTPSFTYSILSSLSLSLSKLSFQPLRPLQLLSASLLLFHFVLFSLFPIMEGRIAIPRNFAIPSFAVWVLLLIGSVCARFVVEKNSITVLAPPEIRSTHDGAVANFGVPDYGGFIVGSVAYPQKGAFGCEPFEGDKPFKFRNRPTVLLLDRGGNLSQR